MARIIGTRKSSIVGRPGFRQFSQRVLRGRLSVNRVFANDPADGILANIGTKRDVIGSTGQQQNLTGSVSPRVVKDPTGGHGAPHGISEQKKRVVNRGKNRRIRKLR
jgi:hypothetical protein